MKGKRNPTANQILLILIGIAALVMVGSCASSQSVMDESQNDGISSSKKITNIFTEEDPEGIHVIIEGSQQLTYTSVKQNFPLGILFYFPETALDSELNVQPENEIIDTIEARQLAEAEAGARILISLKSDMPYDVTPEGLGIKISFSKPAEISEIPEAVTATATAAELQAPPEDTGEQEVSAIPATTLESIYVTKFEDSIKVSIKADGMVENFTTFTIAKPARIVFDLKSLKSPYKKQQIVPVNTKWVSRVRHFAHPEKVRVVLDTQGAYLKSVSAIPTGGGMDIFVGNATDEQKELSRTAQPVTPTAPPAEAEKPAAITASVSSPRVAWVNRIDFRKEAEGKSTVIIGTTRPVSYNLTKKTTTLLQLQLMETRLPKYRMRPLITTRFESAVDRISPIYKPSMKNTTMVTIELREAVAHVIEQQDDILLIRFEASTIPPKPLEQADLPAWQQVMAQTDTKPESTLEKNTSAKTATTTVAELEDSYEPMEKTAAPVPLTPLPEPVMQQPITASVGASGINQLDALVHQQPGQRKRYTGEKIALDFYETDIKNVFRILREISGKNFAIDRTVKGSVTLTLEKPVPWDQVLDLVLKMNQLGMIYEGDIIRIAPLSTLTAEEKARQERIAAEQKSRQVVKALEPMVTEYIAVNYSDARSEVLPHIQGLVTANRGKISVDARNNQLIITDVPAKIQQIRDVVRRIDTVTPQVIIEAKVVEVTDEFTMDLGIEWSGTYGPINDIFGIDGADLTTNASMNFASEAASTIGFDFSKLTGTPLLINATLNAAEANRQGKIITAPKIITLDNKKAKIKQGVEWPYLERDSSGNATVKFKNIDLLLEVTPTVTPDDRILMKIFITKNDIGTITLGVPSLNTNEAQTELLVNDGDTIVIGGIIKSNIQDSTTGWPGLKDIPLLGWLFKTNSQSETANELLIFITPRIVLLEQAQVS